MGNLPFEKGIKDIKVDLPTKVFTVTYFRLQVAVYYDGVA
jgi:hypothetical protein